MIGGCCIIRNKKGSFQVFIIMAFAAILILVFAVLYASGSLAISSVTDTFGRLWGRSLLAEFDIYLKDRYGIFAFYSHPAMAEEKLDFYAQKTFGKKDYVDYGGASCNMEEYRLTNLTYFKEQISDTVSFDSKPKGFKEEQPDSTYGSRTIKSDWILKGLPSKSQTSQVSITQLVEQIKEGQLLEKLLGNSKINRYLFLFFKDNRNEADLGKTYFKNEIEYIISGKTDDQKALKNVKNKLLVMRNLLNLYYLYTCPEKKDAAMAIAAVMTPGPEAVITQGILLEIWALAEANNDVKLLMEDEKVPLLKKDENWAISLENAMAQNEMTDEEGGKNEAPEGGNDKETLIRPQKIEGSTYRQYLQVLVNTLAEDIKVLRAMDLIQINMKYLYCDYFLLEDYYVGVKFSLDVNGVKHDFEEWY